MIASAGLNYTGVVSTPAASGNIAAAIAHLKARLGAVINDSATVREHHSRGESYHAPAAPDAVCFPTCTEHVVEIMRASATFGVPVVPFGAGSSLEGHVHAVRGGLTIDLREMHRIVNISQADLDATVEAGVTRLQLGKALRSSGLMFPIDPGADATIGGMTATRASGTTAVRYGTMRENVLALQVVMANGDVIRTGGRARKSSAGYDLTRLFVGSEGTLGVITEVTVRLHPVPEAVAAAVCAFDSLEGAVNTVIATIQLGLGVARIELLDAKQIDAINRFCKTTYPLAPTLFFEFNGDHDRHVSEQAQTVQDLAADHGGHGFAFATKLEDREKLWQARHNALYAAQALRPGSRTWTTDVCVPISRLAECILDTDRDNETAPFPVCLVGHAGDGNFHLLYVLDPDSASELESAKRLNDRLISRALAMGGTCTGEHGIGYGKMASLVKEHGAGVDVMRAIKLALDPDNRMNPGKVVL